MADAKKTESAKSGVYHQSIAKVRILIGGNTITRKIPAKDGKAPMVIYAKNAIVTGGETEIHFQESTFEQTEILQEGVYVFAPDLVELGKFNSLQLNRYYRLIYVGELNSTQKLKFQSADNPVEDLL